MQVSQVHLDVFDGCWPDLKDKKVFHVSNDEFIQYARLTKGMTSGESSVAIRVDLDDGRVVMIETSMRSFLLVADLFQQREE